MLLTMVMNFEHYIRCALSIVKGIDINADLRIADVRLQFRRI